MSTLIPDERATEPDSKYLSFYLGREEYGLEILKVREIIGVMDVTPVPNAPEHLLGVINLRGKVIPVTDLRRKFGMESIERTEESCIIVVEADERDIGVLVDKVSEVINVGPGSVEAAPQLGDEVDERSCLLGIAKIAERVALLLDIERALDSGGLSEPAAAAAA